MAYFICRIQFQDLFRPPQVDNKISHTSLLCLTPNFQGPVVDVSFSGGLFRVGVRTSALAIIILTVLQKVAGTLPNHSSCCRPLAAEFTGLDCDPSYLEQLRQLSARRLP